jgi:hypothetical protein
MSPRERQKARVFNLEGSDGKGFPRSDSEEKKDAWHKQKTRPMNRAFLACGNFDRAGLEARFLSAWSRSDQLFHLIKDSEMLVRPIVWRHPFIFYVGHLPAFTWNQIGRGIFNWKSFNPYFDDLFCRGMDPDVDSGECHWHPDVPDVWPRLRQVEAYRDKVREAILESLDIMPWISSSDIMVQNGRACEMVLEHEYMHQETLLYMMQELAIEAKNRPEKPFRYSFRAALPSRAIEIPAGTARAGARFSEVDFGWDNEFGEVTLNIPRFTIDSLPVTNAEFLEFVQCGAYDDPCHWRPED